MRLSDIPKEDLLLLRRYLNGPSVYPIYFCVFALVLLVVIYYRCCYHFWITAAAAAPIAECNTDAAIASNKRAILATAGAGVAIIVITTVATTAG